MCFAVMVARALTAQGARFVTSSPPRTETSGKRSLRRPFLDGTESIEGPMFLRGKGGACLNFLHVPKTAGGFIESSGFHVRAMSSSTDWGMYDKDLNCSSSHPEFNGHMPGDGTEDSYWGKRCYFSTQQGHGSCSIFHIPPAFDPVLAEHYAECDTFCVVRHPGRRMFSEFNWALYWGAKYACAEYAKWVEDSLKGARQDPYGHDCHLIPQSLYVFGQQGVNAPRTCNRVLRFENLESEFNALMYDFQIPLTFASGNATGFSGHASSSCASKFDNDIPAVKDYYATDYEAFGYYA
eukprot:CAMPEP_0168399048 /NCGR_PEP_ID=MMETSP0228-20121227/21891_1 /TAXON_ID=133427 /ORGANISM="Protoceratium reticulatum, Strain CCCM 535 (=CCMP 1889)" /LENGTH=294 /DNA_ID=CAMNT_0008412565 /DNA_START=100 /DNA_END=984 /DNA_ORIENTATION=+